MIRTSTILVLFAILSLRVGASIAVERTHAASLSFVYPLGTGDFVIGFANDSAQCNASGTPKYMYVVVGQNGVTADGSKKMFATAAMAFALAKPLSVAFDDGTAYCYINRLSVNNP